MLKKFKKSLRLTSTDAENKLWYYLRNRQIMNMKFRRQHIIQGYIVDFVCLERKIVIELDGGHHMEQEKYDEERTKKLISDGFVVLRFWNNEVFENLNGVLQVIYDQIINPPHPP